MHLDDENALVLFDVIRYCCIFPIAVRWWRKGFKVRIFFLAPIFFISDLAANGSIHGLPDVIFVWGVTTSGIGYLNNLLWDATRELIIDSKSEARRASGARSLFVIACLGLLSQYAQVFTVLGMKDTSADPVRVTHNIFAGAYFTVMTWTTVGYGDLVPNGASARFFAALAALNGYALLALIIAYLIPVLSNLSRKPSLVGLFDFEERMMASKAARLKADQAGGSPPISNPVGIDPATKADGLGSSSCDGC